VIRGAAGRGRDAFFLGTSALLHAAAVLAMLWAAGRELPTPVEQPVALVWDSEAQGAADPEDSAGTAFAAPAPPAAPPPAPPGAEPPSVPAPPPSPAAMPPAPPAARPPPPGQVPDAPPAAAAAPPPPLPPLALPAAPDGLLPPPPAPAPPAQQAAAPPGPPQEDPAPPVQEAALPPPPPPAPPVPAQPASPTPPQQQAAASPRRIWSPPSREAADGESGPLAAAAGGGIASGAIRPPRAAGSGNRAPEYPLASRRRGEEGRVTLLVQVDTTGRVQDLSVLGSSGHATLDREAERAVRGWRFEPAIQDGRPVFSTLPVVINFRLEGDRRW
jgi:protein TonB